MLHNIPIGLQITNNENTGTDGVTRKFNNIANAWSLDSAPAPAPQQAQPQQPQQEPEPYYGNRPPFMQQQQTDPNAPPF